jgi:arylformamidase
MNLIDLTHPLVNGQSAYPGASTPVFTWHSTFESKGRTSSNINMSTHSGTHVDAPLHFIPGGTSIDQLPLSSMCGDARVIDLSKCPHEERLILESDFFSAAEDIRKGEIAIVYLGIDIHFGAPEFLAEMAALPTVCVQWLVDKGISAYGTDAYSVDLMDRGDFSNHKVLLGAGIPIIEALNNIGSLPKHSFFFAAFPLNLQGREASPCRAVAFPDLKQDAKGNSYVH